MHPNGFYPFPKQNGNKKSLVFDLQPGFFAGPQNLYDRIQDLEHQSEQGFSEICERKQQVLIPCCF